MEVGQHLAIAPSIHTRRFLALFAMQSISLQHLGTHPCLLAFLPHTLTCPLDKRSSIYVDTSCRGDIRSVSRIMLRAAVPHPQLISPLNHRLPTLYLSVFVRASTMCFEKATDRTGLATSGSGGMCEGGRESSTNAQQKHNLSSFR